MKVFDFIDKVVEFHGYVMHEHTGNAKAFAQKLGVSRATLYNIIAELKLYDIKVRYSRIRETYYYECPNNVRISVSIQQLNDDELKNISGGTCFKYLSMDLDKLILCL